MAALRETIPRRCHHTSPLRRSQRGMARQSRPALPCLSAGRAGATAYALSAAS